MNYKIADLKVSIEKPCSITKARSEKYVCKSFDVPDIIVKRNYDSAPKKYLTEDEQQAYFYVREGRNFYVELLKYNGFMLHASAVVYDNRAYLFSASSGTGKSTHTSLWLKRFGNKAFVLNDDKPAIRIIDNNVYAYGTPWSGKNDISVNAGYKIGGICFIERSESNRISRIDAFTAASLIYYSTIRSIPAEDTAILMNLINQVIEKTPIYQMGCNMDPEAAEVAYNGMK